MALDTLVIRSAIKAKLEAAGAENVYTEDPRLIDWEAVVDSLRQTNREYVQCWVMRRVSSIPHTSETNHGRVPTCEVHWEHTYNITLFFGYIEAVSEDVMQALVDTILSYFQSVRTLDGLVFGNARPLALQGIQPAELGGIGGYEARFALTFYDVQTSVVPV